MKCLQGREINFHKISPICANIYNQVYIAHTLPLEGDECTQPYIAMHLPSVSATLAIIGMRKVLMLISFGNC